MSEASKTFNPGTSQASINATSLPGLGSGVTPCALPDGPMTDLFGREAVLARVSAPQEKARGLLTLVTSGRLGIDSSASAALQSSLESRLMRRLDTAGSTLFNLTWRRKVTPLGRRYLERAVSARRTAGSDCTSWPSPVTTDDGASLDEARGKRRCQVSDAAKLAAWPSPNAIETSEDLHTVLKRKATLRSSGEQQGGLMKLGTVAQLAAWPSPISQDSKHSGHAPTGPGLSEKLAYTSQLAAWPMPAERDWRSESATEEFNEKR